MSKNPFILDDGNGKIPTDVSELLQTTVDLLYVLNSNCPEVRTFLNTCILHFQTNLFFFFS